MAKYRISVVRCTVTTAVSWSRIIDSLISIGTEIERTQNRKKVVKRIQAKYMGRFELPANLIGLAKASPFLIAAGLLIDKFDVHMTIHIMGIALAAVLATISCKVYLRDSRPKVLLLTIAFLLLGLQQAMELFESLGFAVVNVPLPLVGVELMHAVSFGAIAFLAAGVLKKS